MKFTKKIIMASSIIVLSLLWCYNHFSPVEINDWYRIYKEDEFGEGYYLMCKLGCNYDAKIENIIYASWNKQYIIVEQKVSETKESIWYIVKAHGEELMCCNRDTVIGPLTKSEKDNYLQINNIKTLKKKKF